MKKYVIFMSVFSLLLFLFSCEYEKSPKLKINGHLNKFSNQYLNQPSDSKKVSLKGLNISKNIFVESTEDFEISKNNHLFSHEVTYTAEELSKDVTLYVRFVPKKLGARKGKIIIKSADFEDQTIDVSGYCINKKKYTYHTFDSEHLAHGSNYSQSSTKKFKLHDDLSNIEKIYMAIKLRCPEGGCGVWDVYSNIMIKNPTDGVFYEIGRYITPYRVDNSQIPEGFIVDVTDFKSLLKGDVELKAFIEVWASQGWLLSVDFIYEEGVPDYPFYAIAPVLQYNENSLEGVVYGKDVSKFDLKKTITIPKNAKETSLRTIITGWGHVNAGDSDGRRCAEWCFRTHHIKINNNQMFTHDMDALGCADNPVNSQDGNWEDDRAGWCPGMAVPIRNDVFKESMNGKSFSFEYDFEKLDRSVNPKAYYAISTFVIVKSNKPIEVPKVSD